MTALASLSALAALAALTALAALAHRLSTLTALPHRLSTLTALPHRLATLTALPHRLTALPSLPHRLAALATLSRGRQHPRVAPSAAARRYTAPQGKAQTHGDHQRDSHDSSPSGASHPQKWYHRASPDFERNPMRLATWNINGLRARFEYVCHWLRAVQPDVVGFQELKATDDKFPAMDFQALGYHSVSFGQKSWNGVAVLSKTPIEITQVGLPGQEEMGSRLLSVDTAGINFTTVYVPNGKTLEHEDFARKLKWLQALNAHYVERHDPAKPTVLCGDFNVVPAPIDHWRERPGIFTTPEERGHIQSLLDWGFTDVWRAQRPEAPGFSWWDYRAGAFHKHMGLRIDLLLASHDLAQKVTSVDLERTWRKKVEGLTPSDHAPVWMDLDP